MNSSLALKTIEVLKDQVKIPVEAVRKGLLETRWQGRMETVLPGVIVDGAHNEDGVEICGDSSTFPERLSADTAFSAVDDKDYTDMIRTILGKISFHHVIVTQVGGYRKVPAEKLAEIFREKAVRQRKPAKMWKKRLRKLWRQKEKTECYSVSVLCIWLEKSRHLFCRSR